MILDHIHQWQRVPAHSSPSFERFQCVREGCDAWGYRHLDQAQRRGRKPLGSILLYVNGWAPPEDEADVTAKPVPEDEQYERLMADEKRRGME